MKWMLIFFSCSLLFAADIASDEEIIKDLDFFQNMDVVKVKDLFIGKEIKNDLEQKNTKLVESNDSAKESVK